MFVLDAMLSAPKTKTTEMRKLEKLMRVKGVRLKAMWIPSAKDNLGDSLSRTWHPGCVCETVFCPATSSKSIAWTHGASVQAARATLGARRI